MKKNGPMDGAMKACDKAIEAAGTIPDSGAEGRFTCFKSGLATISDKLEASDKNNEAWPVNARARLAHILLVQALALQYVGSISGSTIGGDATKNVLRGLGAAAPVAQDAVKVTMPQPIKTSTIYAVVGASAVAIIGSVALWAYLRSKGK